MTSHPCSFTFESFFRLAGLRCFLTQQISLTKADMAAFTAPETNWQSSKNSLKERNKHMFNNTLISDVKFSIIDSNSDPHQSLVIPAHKYILAISSSVFFAMFYGEMAEPGDTIELPDCNSDSFLELLRFVYYDEVKLTGSNVIQVLYLANKYMIPSLSDECTKFLRQNLDANNVFSVLPGVLIYEEASLVKECWDMVDEHSEEAMYSEAFLDITHEMLSSVLQRDTLSACEVDIFKAVDRWAEHRCKKTQREVTGDEKRKELGEAINLIRFPLMTEEEIASLVPKTKLLLKDDICDIFLYFNNALESPLIFSDVPRNTQQIKRIMRFKAANDPGSAWHYDGIKHDSVALSVSDNVVFHGVRLFGREGATYSVTVGIYDKRTRTVTEKLTEKVGTFDTDKDITNGYYGFDVLFKRPVPVKRNEKYEIRAVIKGPISYYGDQGQTQVTDQGICFSFSAASSSTNGTSVTCGQFPEILFL